MRTSRNSRPVLMTLVLGLLLVAAQVAYAGDLTYLALQREGQASVAIDKKKKAAYIIDLGRGGDGDQVKLENLPLLDRLEQLGIENLFFVCSHPHSDHMGGIRALFRRPRVFFRDDGLTNPRFKSINVIDDGVSNTLYLELQRSLAKNTLIKTRHLSATNRNAFAGISARADDVYIETIPYPVPTKAGPHGRAVITYIQLGQKQIIVDFDDAESAAIQKAVDMLTARGETEITTFVAPHHGSRYHDVSPVVELLHPKRVIIAVNPENRYGHPSPPILLKLIETLGKENVLFTGSMQNVVLDDDGVKSAMFTAADKDSYAMFVAPNRVRAEKMKNVEDIKACAAIQALMEGDRGGTESSGGGQPDDSASGRGGSARTLLVEEVKLNGSILQPEFEFGAVSYGRDDINVLHGNKVFAYALTSPTDLAGQDVAVVLERPIDASGNVPDKLNKSEARSILQRLTLLGNNAERAKNVYVYFSTPIGLPDVLEPSLVIQPQELLALSAPPPLAPRRPTATRPRSGRWRRPGPLQSNSPSPKFLNEPLPRGGMVFLQGNKLFPVGEATELLGGSLDVCGMKYCVRTSDSTVYELPFSPGQLFSEVWERVHQRRIDSFYLSINPTKQFLRNLDSGFGQIPSDRLKFGGGRPGGGIRAHEVVTAGDIQGTQIGQILWEADVAFKSKSLGYNVLTGDRDTFFSAPYDRVREKSKAGATSLNVPYRSRWCRLYWTSGSQGIEVEKSSGRITFKGNAVLARSEPMVMRGGDLVDETRGTWCSDSKSVAASLQQQANSGHGGPVVLQQLRELAEIQSFVRWARDNGITPTEAFSRSVEQHNSAPAYEVPTWTSGIKSDPRVQIWQQGSLSGGSSSNFLHVSLDDSSTQARCVLPYWAQRESDFSANGIYKDANGIWRIPPEKYQFVDSWMGALAGKIAACSGGSVLSLSPIGRAGTIIHARQSNTEIGINFHLQSIHMHGGVLLGVQRDFLESASKEKGLLLSLNRRPLFQNTNGKLHFWNYSGKHPQYGSLAQHVTIEGKVAKVSAQGGHLSFEVTTEPGAIVLQESRWGHANNFTKGLEWAGARHASDGSWVWRKAVWPCASGERSTPNCVNVDGITLDELKAKIGGERRDDSSISVTQLNENTWVVDLNISSFRSELNRRWEEIPSSDMNAHLSLIYEFAKWGFIDEALEKYLSIAAKIKGDTVDTILRRLLEMPSGDN